MLAALVRFPLIFVSGIFIPVSQMTGVGRYVTYCSPLTYLVDALNMSAGQVSVFPWWVDILVMVAFAAVFLLVAVTVLRRRSLRGM
jgi:ABC-2 type transport system permease protein